MHKKLSNESSLENFKREAKRWFGALRENDPAARARIERTGASPSDNYVLRDVQHALAKEYGFDGWNSLRVAVEAVASSRTGVSEVVSDEIVSRFLTNACPDWRLIAGRELGMAKSTASRLLQQHPAVASANIYTAVATGRFDVVREFLKQDATLASRAGGVRNWPPLLYLACARLNQSSASEHSVDIAKLLLENGADPNVYCPGGKELIGYDEGGIHFTVLTCTIGRGETKVPSHPKARELAALLLENDAEPYDVQVIYNVFADHGSRALLKDDIVWLLDLIYEHSLRRGRANDWKDPQWKMLDVGRYGPGAHFLLSAAVRVNQLGLVEWLLAHGAHQDVRSYDPRVAGQSFMGYAKRTYNDALERLLVRFGADPVVAVNFSVYERFIDSCLSGDRASALALLAKNPGWLRDPNALLVATRRNSAIGVQILLELGIPVDIEENAHRGRAIHAAAFSGATDAARVLLDAGADPDFRELAHNAMPMGVAIWAQQPAMVDLLAEYSRDIFNLVFAGKTDRIRQILKEDPSLAAKIENGQTTLMRLPDDEERAVEIAEMLLEAGADPTLRDSSGATAADIAERRALMHVRELL